MIDRTKDSIVICLSQRERAVLWSMPVIASVGSVLAFLTYQYAASLLPRANAAYLALSLGGTAFVAYFLFVGRRESWFRCRFVADRTKLQKIYPSGRVIEIRWNEVKYANRWTDLIVSEDGTRMFIGYFGNSGFWKKAMVSLYELAGDDSVFTRQMRGIP